MKTENKLKIISYNEWYIREVVAITGFFMCISILTITLNAKLEVIIIGLCFLISIQLAKLILQLKRCQPNHENLS